MYTISYILSIQLNLHTIPHMGDHLNPLRCAVNNTNELTLTNTNKISLILTSTPKRSLTITNTH